MEALSLERTKLSLINQVNRDLNFFKGLDLRVTKWP